jgi:hypothetical protein
MKKYEINLKQMECLQQLAKLLSVSSVQAAILATLKDIEKHQEIVKDPDVISLHWSTEDVQSVRPDLSDKQARQVLSYVQDKYDADVGVSWMTIEVAADLLFGEEKEVPDAFAAFIETYKPIQNSLVVKAPFGGLMFETFGAEYEAVKKANELDARCIWTLLDCDGAEVIASGWHFVNRIGYFICSVPFEGEFLEITISEASEEEETEEEEDHV